MILIDPKFARPSMRDKSLSALDTEISSILENDAPDDEKAKLYLMALKRAKFYGQDPTPATKPVDKLESTVLDSLPPIQRYKAKRTMDLLKRDSAVDFDGQGQLVYRQSVVPGSNIVDLISDVTRTKSTEDPIGWEALAESLRDNKASHDFISNTRSWNFMRDPKPKRSKVGKARRWLEY